MTAAASDAVNNEQPWAHSTSMLLEDITPATTSLFLQEWNTFYQEFIWSTTYGATTPTSKLFNLSIIDNNAILPPSTQQWEASNANDIDQLWSYSDSAIMEEIDSEITPIDLNKWNAFKQSLFDPPHIEHSIQCTYLPIWTSSMTTKNNPCACSNCQSQLCSPHPKHR